MARRVLPVHVPPLNRGETLKTLKHLVRNSARAVAPAAIQSAVEFTNQQGAIQPAAAIGQLGAALAETGWRHHNQLTPDDITSILRPQWPDPSPDP